MRPGDPSVPIVYEVGRIRNGKSFTTRRVVAIQHGRQIFTLAASFQVPQEGVEHQFDMPDVPLPEELDQVFRALQPFQAKDIQLDIVQLAPLSAMRSAVAKARSSGRTNIKWPRWVTRSWGGSTVGQARYYVKTWAASSAGP